MAWSLTAFTIVGLVSATVAIAVGVAVLRERPDPMAVPLALLMFAIAAWALPEAISFGFDSAPQVLFWQRIAYFGVVAAPVMYLVVTLRYANKDEWLSRGKALSLAIVPVGTLLIVWTNSYHSLYWRSVSVGEVGAASVLIPTFGPWYWVNLGYLYVITLVALMVLGAMVVRSGPIYQKQAALMFVGGLVPLATNVAIEFGAGPDPMVDLTSTALTATGITFALALFHFDLLEIRPVAHTRLINELDDGVIVLGPDGRIRDFNPTAERILEDIEINQPAGDLLPEYIVPDGGELVVDTDDGERRYRSRMSWLTDAHGNKAGRIIYLNDVTDIVLREQRISVLNRILRHNIRNELNVVSGNLERLETQVPPDSLQYVETAKVSTQRVLDFAEKARHVERTLRETDARVAVSATAVAERVVTDARARFPDATISFEPPLGTEPEATVDVVDADLFELALSELVENAVVHADVETPEVAVRITGEGDEVRISVADNGPGLSEQDKAIQSSLRETQLEHGSGLGLWLVAWTASLSSGELSFSENEPRGTVATLRLPGGEE